MALVIRTLTILLATTAEEFLLIDAVKLDSLF